MSVLQNPVQHVLPETQTRLPRLLLQCRYDFQNNIWNLPAPQARLGDRLSFANSQAALLPLLTAVIAQFSDPSLGGANPSKSASRRMGIRHSSQRSLGKTKTTKERKNEN